VNTKEGLVIKLRAKLIERLQDFDKSQRPKTARFDKQRRYGSHF